jgi:aminopeptidase N
MSDPLQAHFNVSVVSDHPVVLSNMPEVSVHPVNSTSDSLPALLHTFEVTPLMSTYLLAIVMGDLVHLEMGCRLTDGIVGGTAKNISIRGWSTSSR